MARQNRLLIVGFFALAASALGQAPDAGKAEAPTPELNNRRAPEFETALKALEALAPQQRKQFHENFLRWSNLPPEEKKALRDQQELRKQRMADEIRGVLREFGMTLEGERRQQFVRRYAEERRKIEEQLRKETEEKRQARIRETLNKLKAEFTDTQGAPSPPSPPSSPSSPPVPPAETPVIPVLPAPANP